jgi:transcriptional regulator with XRE-family HTH domain
MTVRQYRLKLKWSVSRLAKAAGIAPQTLARVEEGEATYDYILAGIAEALSGAFKKTITIDDLEGVKIIGRD